MMSPSISLITTTFNAAKSIAITLDSVLSQRYTNFEHIIIDAKSSDKTLQIIESYRPKYAKKGISLLVVSEADKGIYDGMNKGLKCASGEIVGFLNADDSFTSSHILDYVAWGFAHPDDMDIIYANVAYISAQRTLLRYLKGRPFSHFSFKCGYHPPHPSFYAKKSLYEKYGHFNLTYHIAADYEIMLRFLYKYEAKSLYIDKCFVNMLNGGTSNASLYNICKANIECINAWRDNHLSHLPLFVLLKPLLKLKDKMMIYFKRNGGGDRLKFLLCEISSHWHIVFIDISSQSLAYLHLSYPYFSFAQLDSKGKSCVIESNHITESCAQRLCCA